MKALRFRPYLTVSLALTVKSSRKLPTAKISRVLETSVVQVCRDIEHAGSLESTKEA